MANWTDLSGAFGYGTKLTSAQQQQLRDNITAAFEKASGAPQLATNYITATMISAAAVAQSELKTGIGAVSTSNTGATNLTLPGGTYGFYPQTKRTDAAEPYYATIAQTGRVGSTYVTGIQLHRSAGGGGDAYAQQRYIQASPPYKIGDTEWGHFVFVLRKIATGEIVAGYEAEDPPWAYNGPLLLPKDDAGRISHVPHPFIDYFEKPPEDDGLEIIMVDMRDFNTEQWKQEALRRGKDSVLEELSEVIPLGAVKPHGDFNLADIPGFTDRVKIRARN